MERLLWDGDCLYEYGIIEDEDNPTLIIYDLSGMPDLGRHQKYWEVKHNVEQVIAEIAYTLLRKLDGMVAVCCDTNGTYSGIDLLGQYHRRYPLSQEKSIHDESEALEIARKLHIMRKQQLAKIMDRLPREGIVQYSQVFISCYGGGGISYYTRGYPSNQEIATHPEYIRMCAENPDVKSFCVEVVSYKVSRASSPISDTLLKDIIAYGADVFRNQSIVEPGDARNQVVHTQYLL